MPNTVRAKVTCSRIAPSPYGAYTDLSFVAVYSDDPSNENKAFSDATPCLSLSMSIANDKPALQAFQVGQEYYLDFTPAMPAVDPQQAPLIDATPDERGRYTADADEARADALADQADAAAYDAAEAGGGYGNPEAVPHAVDGGAAGSTCDAAQDGGSADCGSADSGGGSSGD